MSAVTENHSASPPTRAFHRYAWAVLGYVILVVLWGAFVRATGSGAGCGNHWPLCNGDIVPRAPAVETIIEFGHRVTSGLSLIAVLLMWVWSRRVFPRFHVVRYTAALSLVFLLVEALLGAGLVLLEYVEQNASAGRAVYLSAHLANTLVLLGFLTLTAWLSGTPARPFAWRARPNVLIAALPVTLLLSVTGAIAALGDTLYPASTLTEGLRADFSSASPALLRLRMLHPAAAVLASIYLLFAAMRGMGRAYQEPVRRAAWYLFLLVIVQLAAGALNLALLAPVWMQLLHLLLADLLWIALVIMVVEAVRLAPVPAGQPA